MRYEYDEDDPRLVAKLEAETRALARRIEADEEAERQWQDRQRQLAGARG